MAMGTSPVESRLLVRLSCREVSREGPDGPLGSPSWDVQSQAGRRGFCHICLLDTVSCTLSEAGNKGVQ